MYPAGKRCCFKTADADDVCTSLRTSPLGDHQLPAYYKQYDGCTLSTSRQLSPASYSSCGAAPPIGSLLLGLRDGGGAGDAVSRGAEREERAAARAARTLDFPVLETELLHGESTSKRQRRCPPTGLARALSKREAVTADDHTDVRTAGVHPVGSAR